MIYILNNKNNLFTKKLISYSDLSQNIKSKIKSDLSICDYFIYQKSSNFCMVGLLRVSKNYSCIVDLYNKDVSSLIFFKFINYLLRNEKNIYAVPNKKGEFIWKVMKFNVSNLNFHLSPKKFVYKKFIYKSYRYLFLNLLWMIKPSEKQTPLTYKKIFYKVKT